MITAIRTNNFKKLENFSASFKDGTNLVFGENGEGKSTCFDAIRFALFGSKGVAGTVDSLTTWNKDKMWVELDINGHTIRRTSSNCKITKDDEVVASGNAPSIKYVEDMLSCSVKDFDLLYMSKQNETAGLITFGATELNRKVEEYAGVAVIDKIIKALGSEINGCQIALQSFEFEPVDELKEKEAKLSAEIASLRPIYAQLTEKMKTLSEEANALAQKLKDDRNFNREQDAIAAQASDHNSKVEKLQAQIETLKSYLDKANDKLLEAKEVDADELASVKADLDKVKALNHELSRLPVASDLAKELEATKDYLEQLKVYEADVPALLSAVEKAQAVYDEARDANAKALSDYKKACKEAEDGVCSGCNRPLEGHDPETAKVHAEEKAKALNSTKSEMTTAKSELDDATAKLNAHYKTNPGNGWEEKVAQLEAKIETTKLNRESLEKRLSGLGLEETLESKLTQMRSDQKEYSLAIGAVNSAQEDLDSANVRMDKLRAMNVEQPQPKRDTAEDENKLTKLNADLNDAITKQGEAKTEGVKAKERLTSVQNQLSGAEANNKKMAELEKQLDLAKQLRKYLNEERVKFMEGVWRTILGTASHFINKSTDGWITSVGRNDKGDFTFTENNYEAVAKESASGAQKAFIGTAIKVGLAQAKMGSSAMIMLDEPTADMRDDRASQLAAGLMMLPGQKIMITHRDSERMIAQNIIHVGE
ncbi:double-stranded DNA repair protein [Vibrio phage vB_VpaS_1601]|nr:double-stranded DNA repair protein [Vibrio phage vB_VpaP_1601]